MLKKLSNSQTAIVVALIGIIPAILTYIIKPEKSLTDINKESHHTIIQKVHNVPGYKNYAYPNMCLGFAAPSSWSLEDAAANFAGSELDLVKRYEQTGGIIGVKFRIQSVQKNYINNIEIETKNQLAVLKKIDPTTTVKDVTISGRHAKCFSYKQKTGELYGDIKLFFVRLIPEVKLVIVAFARDESSDEEEFWDQFNVIKHSIYFDTSEIEKRTKLMQQS